MRASIVLAAAVVFGGCASVPAGGARDLADVGSIGSRQCQSSTVPGRLRSAEELVEAGAVVAELVDAPPGHTVLSLIYGPDGKALRNEVVVAGPGYQASLRVRNVVAAHLLPQKPQRSWGERLIVSTGPAPALTVARQEICPAQALDGRVQDSYVIGVGASLPGGMDPVSIDRYQRAGYRQLRIQALIDEYGRLRDLSRVGSTGLAYPVDYSRDGPFRWLYDMAFEPTLVDGIPTAAWIDLWLLVPESGLGLATQSWGGWGTPLPPGYWPRPPRTPRTPQRDTASGGTTGSGGDAPRPDTIGITIPMDMPRVLPPAAPERGRPGEASGEPGRPKKPLLPPATPSEPDAPPEASPPERTPPQRPDPRLYRPHETGQAPEPSPAKPASKPEPAPTASRPSPRAPQPALPAPEPVTPKVNGEAPKPKAEPPKAEPKPATPAKPPHGHGEIGGHRSKDSGHERTHPRDRAPDR